MLLYPSLAAGFLFIGVPLLVHLINLLRHRRTQWAAMDFLLASYRKQRRWIVLRQLLLLLTRLAVAALLIAVLAGLIGGRGLIGVIGGQTTHHVIVLDDSYSMRQRVAGGAGSGAAVGEAPAESGRDSTAYDRALASIASLVRGLSTDEGIHQLTVMRASRAALIGDANKGSADAAADLAAQTVTGDARQIERLMSTRASTLRTDLVAAIDLASDLLTANPADSRRLYVVSDFSRRDWQSPRRIAVSLEKAKKSGAEIRMIDCVETGSTARPRNLAITDLAPEPDVWVAGVPVMMNVTVKNYSDSEAKNVALTANVITYGDDVKVADPTSTFSGSPQSLPAIMIESIPAGQQLTKTFQVYIDKQGTHVVRVGLPDDALAVDNTRVCTIPLADAQRVLIVDGNSDGIGGYHVSSVLDPGSQVRIGAIPEVRPAAMLRDATLETLQRYRAIYLIDVPEINERASDTLSQYVRDGGGLAWFLGNNVSAENYNRNLASPNRQLLPFELDRIETASDLGFGGDDTDPAQSKRESALVFGKDAEMLGPISRAGNGVFGLVNLQRVWSPAPSTISVASENTSPGNSLPNDAPENDMAADATLDASGRPVPPATDDPLDLRILLERGDGVPVAVRHTLGRGRIVTVNTGLDGKWNNWPGDPTFVVFLLQTNAMLFSGASQATSRLIDEPAELPIPGDSYLPTALLLPPADEPPRMSIELEADDQSTSIVVSPTEMVISEQAGVEDFLMPGIAEWQRTGTDGQTSVLPLASVLRVGESDLAQVTHAEVLRDLPGMGIEFMSTGTWESDGNIGGMSTFLLILLALLAILLGIEQALAAWASYHAKPGSAGQGRRHVSGIGSARGVHESAMEIRPRGRSRSRRAGAVSSVESDETTEVTQ
ncbi:BatA domain-containing protein [Aporhodopirellula aestuarii]|uniref:BatA domain-containing protein n=1 Tax=Aporhodopirellula aestuarii TaxID=2950107 RepID=A0ABT0TXM2_9BACT|nr:BatA domain-containing protein [Aporhodopirellula aestuarii]MCM2369336.1 BatA domain-containing protein [Aporhodopirellula aestuarii]